MVLVFNSVPELRSGALRTVMVLLFLYLTLSNTSPTSLVELVSVLSLLYDSPKPHS